jgi:hypothetical protein
MSIFFQRRAASRTGALSSGALARHRVNSQVSGFRCSTLRPVNFTKLLHREPVISLCFKSFRFNFATCHGLASFATRRIMVPFIPRSHNNSHISSHINFEPELDVTVTPPKTKNRNWKNHLVKIRTLIHRLASRIRQTTHEAS